jgi:hypothetical protein
MTRVRSRVAFYRSGLCFAFFIFRRTHPYFLRPRYLEPRFLEGSPLTEVREGMMVLLLLAGSVSLGYDLVAYDRKK